MSEQPTDNVIRITKEEATSVHVEDMLKRQMSLRGEPGVTRDRTRRWYLQNWFVFALVGLIAAVSAWAIIEPIFYDMLYLQGPIEKMGTESDIMDDGGLNGGKLRFNDYELGWIKIKGQKIWLLEGTMWIRHDGSRKRVRFSDLKEGQSVGIYSRYVDIPGEDGLAVGHYITTDLKTQSAKEAGLSLHQLAARTSAASLLLFPLIAGFIGLMIGAVDGFICRLPRRALVSGLVGLIVGFIGGFIAHIVAGLVYTPLNHLAMAQMGNGYITTFGFIVQMIGRSLAWGLAGCAMGLGQGIALRSKRLLIYGLLGGAIGGLLGGLLFDPIDMLVIGDHKPSAAISRLIGFAVIGLSVGGLIGVVELLARDAWLRMTQGPLAGKEFLLFKDVMNIGSSPRSDIYLFNDPLVIGDHAVLRAVGDECEIESRHRDSRVLLNSRPVQQARLRHGDQITIGRTMFVFEKRKG